MEEIFKKYKELSKLEKESKASKEKLREDILAEFKRTGEFKLHGIVFREDTKIDTNHEAFYNWVAKTFPDHLDKMTAKMIDYEKFSMLSVQGVIDYDEIPKECYTSKKQPVLTMEK